MITERYIDSEGNVHWPDAYLGSKEDYGVDWHDVLTKENNVLTGVTWTVPAELVDSDETTSGDLVGITLACDTIGTHVVKCVIDSEEGGKFYNHVIDMYLTVV